MTPEEATVFYNKVYDILVACAGAHEAWRSDFVWHHSRSDTICEEYRIGGKLGFGGKYLSGKNIVECYREDRQREECEAAIDKTNRYLAELKHQTSKTA